MKNYSKDISRQYHIHISYQISPLSFYQVNPMQTQKLYAKALEYADLHGEETVWDLYCGIGTISTPRTNFAFCARNREMVPIPQ